MDPINSHPTISPSPSIPHRDPVASTATRASPPRDPPPAAPPARAGFSVSRARPLPARGASRARRATFALGRGRCELLRGGFGDLLWYCCCHWVSFRLLLLLRLMEGLRGKKEEEGGSCGRRLGLRVVYLVCVSTYYRDSSCGRYGVYGTYRRRRARRWPFRGCLSRSVRRSTLRASLPWPLLGDMDDDDDDVRVESVDRWGVGPGISTDGRRGQISHCQPRTHPSPANKKLIDLHCKWRALLKSSTVGRPDGCVLFFQIIYKIVWRTGLGTDRGWL